MFAVFGVFPAFFPEGFVILGELFLEGLELFGVFVGFAGFGDEGFFEEGWRGRLFTVGAGEPGEEGEEGFEG